MQHDNQQDAKWLAKAGFNDVYEFTQNLNLDDIKLVIINNTKELDEIYMSKAAFENVVDKSKVKKKSDLFDIPFDKEDNLDLFKK